MGRRQVSGVVSEGLLEKPWLHSQYTGGKWRLQEVECIVLGTHFFMVVLRFEPR